MNLVTWCLQWTSIYFGRVRQVLSRCFRAWSGADAHERRRAQTLARVTVPYQWRDCRDQAEAYRGTWSGAVPLTERISPLFLLHFNTQPHLPRGLDLWLHNRRLSIISCARAAVQWAQGRDLASLVWFWRRRDSTGRQWPFPHSYSLSQTETSERMQGLLCWFRKATISLLFLFSNLLPTSLLLSCSS